MKILITGGTGFIGSRLALKCLHEGHSVRTLALQRNGPEEANAREIAAAGGDVIEGSVTDAQTVEHACRDIDLVYHLAAAQHETNVPPRHYHDVNVTGTRNVLQAALNNGVRRVVHASTIGVYGNSPRAPVDDAAPLEPDNVYGVTKLEGERIAHEYAAQLPVVVVRVSETYGPGDRRLLKLFKALKRRRFVHIGSERNVHHPIYIDDLIAALQCAAVHPEAAGATFVLAGPRPLTTQDMIDAICRVVGAKPPRLRVPLGPLQVTASVMEKVLPPLRIQPPLHRRRLDFFIKNFQFDGHAARAILGYLPTTDFCEGVRRTAEWYQLMHWM